MKFIKNNWKSFSDRWGGSWFYWNANSHHIQLLKEYKKVFSKFINKTSKVLDVGAGRLFYKKILKKYSDNYKSLDFQKTHPELDYIGAASKTGLEEDSFDVIFCSQVLEHVPDPNDCFAEMRRILKEGGVAIISTPFLMYLHNEPYDYYRYTKHALKKMALENKFQILELKEVGGLFGLFGRIFTMVIIGTFWGIPLIKWLFYVIDLLFQHLFFFLDKISGNKKIFPANYLLVLKK